MEAQIEGGRCLVFMMIVFLAIGVMTNASHIKSNRQDLQRQIDTLRQDIRLIEPNVWYDGKDTVRFEGRTYVIVKE